MDYEIVELESKTVVGVKIRTSNNDENMKKNIGELWRYFFSKDMYSSIGFKKNNLTIGLYSNYENDVNGEYDVTVCCEVTNAQALPEGTVKQIIPAGKYAKFIVCGPMDSAAENFWPQLWNMDIHRSYAYDFEEYHSIENTNNFEIHIYISIQ